MKAAVRRIGVFTSGGDAPGMNAAIRAVVRASLHYGIECIGIRRGYHGLLNGDFTRLDFESVSDISRRGGTMLYSARSLEFIEEAGRNKALATCKLLGMDALVGIGVVLLGSGAGVLASTVNPFATGIASGFAGVSLGDGLVVRIIMLVVFDAAAIWYVMAYAARVRNHPERSLTAGLAPAGTAKKGGDIPALDGRRKLVLALFALVFLVMIYAVIPFDEIGLPIPTLSWWFPELSGLFFVGGAVIGLACGLGEEKTAEAFVAGASELVGVALIIGISRGITVLMNDGGITDTILHWGEEALSGTGAVSFVLLVYLLYLPLTVLIPSSSGLATLSVPIMAPLGEFAGVGGDLVVTAFQSASGLVNIVTPTAAVVMGALALGHVPYDRWLKYVWKLVAYFLLLTMVFLVAGVWLG